MRLNQWIGALLALAVLIAPAMAQTGEKTPQVGEKFPGFSGTAIDGTEVTLADYKGKTVLVDFWATWCGPCLGELPNLKAAYERYHDKGFEVVGISLDYDKSALQRFQNNPETALPWPSIFDGKGWESEQARRYGIRGIPAAFLVDKEGVVVATNVRGAKLWTEVAKHVDPNGPQPPDVRVLFGEYEKATLERRAEIEKTFEEWRGPFQGAFNEIVWYHMDKEDPSPELAKFGLMLMKPVIAEGSDPMQLDTAALAAYAAGDHEQAAKIQRQAFDLMIGDIRRFVEARGMDVAEGASDVKVAAMIPQIHDMLIRLALYEAKTNNAVRAKEILDAVPDSEDRYYKMARKTVAEQGPTTKPATNSTQP